MSDIYSKNLKALEENNPEFHKKLKEIETNEKYEVFLSKDGFANILDNKRQILFYDDPKQFVEKKLKELDQKREHPFLYLFGIGNGKTTESLLKNEKLTQLIVIEPDIELIYIALNLIDFSKDLKKNRLVILEYDKVKFGTIVKMLHVENARYYIRAFYLIVNEAYYEQVYGDQYKELFSLFVKAIEYVALTCGNDINDTFRGVIQHFKNLDVMVENPKFSELKKQKNSDAAVIVSTGPSLTKQIPLLKKYQDRITIISVDASFPILIRSGIKPDIVTSMERDEPTSIFFKEVPAKDQKDIVFACVSLQHEAVLNAIKGETKLLIMRPFAYNKYFDLGKYGFLCKGMSAANMAHELASEMGFKNVALIGQDLAFGDDLKTHADGHVIEEEDPELKAERESGRLMKVEAYGGKGEVYSNIYWNMFRSYIEHHIEESEDSMTTYNATEGGSKIKGAVEISFEEFLQKFAKNKKTHIKLDMPGIEEIKKLKSFAKNKLHTAKERSLFLQKKINDSFLIVAKECEKLENKEMEEAIKVFDTQSTIKLLDEIEKIRKIIETSSIYENFLESVIQPLMYSMELEMAQIKVRYVDNPKDNQIKALQWILAHRYWLFSFSGVVENVIHAIETSLDALEGKAD